ncbi:hypothetical protein [uncultured Adlercreutzia sp.]|uniref:hypothetical protein n=1 Tax=uncultured Adlercreutzia sp. TaxID=875803 RepID=UPI0026F3BC0E|nr:hypothetical protein [uncultured Adlercreutzia sp.]
MGLFRKMFGTNRIDVPDVCCEEVLKAAAAVLKWVRLSREFVVVGVAPGNVGALLDIEGIQYGSVSKNMQHANLAEADHGLSLKGMAKAAYHKAMTDTAAVEEENMHYGALLNTLEAPVQSWVA